MTDMRLLNTIQPRHASIMDVEKSNKMIFWSNNNKNIDKINADKPIIIDKK